MMNSQEINPSKIIGIQFSILSPDEIRNNSVAEITNRDTYINNKPVINGLFDPRMGVLEPGLICPTDGLDYINTPGYHGHIELSRPVFYIQYLNTLLKILRCVCFKCSKLLISNEWSEARRCSTVLTLTPFLFFNLEQYLEKSIFSGITLIMLFKSKSVLLNTIPKSSSAG